MGLLILTIIIRIGDRLPFRANAPSYIWQRKDAVIIWEIRQGYRPSHDTVEFPPKKVVKEKQENKVRMYGRGRCPCKLALLGFPF